MHQDPYPPLFDRYGESNYMQYLDQAKRLVDSIEFNAPHKSAALELLEQWPSEVYELLKQLHDKA